MTLPQAQQQLKEIFGFDHFYDHQWQTIEQLLQGKRVLLIEKTGFGKSLCYQFPATQFDGLTIVFSPLVALMRDQVQQLRERNIAASYISYQHTEEENAQTISDALDGRLKILYIHPARMENAQWLDNARQLNIAMVVVNEAHCISTWGHDFIPAYRKIVNLINLLPLNFPVLATTATATKRVETDIKVQIGRNITSLRGNLLRPNLQLFVIEVKSEDEKLMWLAQNLNQLPGSELVYTGRRVDTEIYAHWLTSLDINAVHYHAGLEVEAKKSIEQSLMHDDYKCVVSTNALGMGIDKPNIRFIIHTQIPVSPIHYYQEIGRAGRDGQRAFIIVFYNPNEDSELPLVFIEGDRPSPKKYHYLLSAIRTERLGVVGLAKATNVRRTEVQVMLADLIGQGLVVEINEKSGKKYEFKYGSAPLDTQPFEELRTAKLQDFDEMLAYLSTKGCRMQFLCRFLGNSQTEPCGKCDNCRKKVVKVDVTAEWKNKVKAFHQTFFPLIKVENKTTHLINGVAGSYYGTSSVGKELHRCKYEHAGDFPDWLLDLTLQAFRQHFANHSFDVLVYVPPTESGDLVRHFAEKVAAALRIRLSHGLKKSRDTQPQKVFQTGLLKNDNVKNAFTFDRPNEIAGKRVLLVDDICDSTATIKEVGRYLSTLGVATIAPLVIAKTVGGR